MALIQCPECGKEISDKTKVCVHCGYPLENTQTDSRRYTIFWNPPSDKRISDVAEILIKEFHFVSEDAQYAAARQPITIGKNLTPEQMNEIKNKFESPEDELQITFSDTNTLHDSHVKMTNENVIYCPKCKSTEYHAGSRGYSLVWGFVGSGKVVLTCLKCGHRWKPGNSQ